MPRKSKKALKRSDKGRKGMKIRYGSSAVQAASGECTTTPTMPSADCTTTTPTTPPMPSARKRKLSCSSEDSETEIETDTDRRDRKFLCGVKDFQNFVDKCGQCRMCFNPLDYKFKVKGADNIIDVFCDACDERYFSVNPEIQHLRSGSWHTRGHSSTMGIGMVIDAHSGLVMDYEVLSKSCQACAGMQTKLAKKKTTQENYNQWKGRHNSECSLNYDGSSGAMEETAAKTIWQRSTVKNLRYMVYIGDGDCCEKKEEEKQKRQQELEEELGGASGETVKFNGGKEGKKVYFRVGSEEGKKVKEVYKRLSDENLLKRCLQGKTQNPNESLHSRIWKFCPKVRSLETSPSFHRHLQALDQDFKQVTQPETQKGVRQLTIEAQGRLPISGLLNTQPSTPVPLFDTESIKGLGSYMSGFVPLSN
ncbi:hypothetical protein Pcinc_005921 [Petrolisthes cinctipes]|uniref:Mutator-like transposase domain-containing protein n=1 Tax=Petrolisthes cinctipes TaxID=88211 RepID=A0AAE1GCE8_PETCI|nr:hypothetical protein Pcinc_005921 [Petrolisthes cinctipes]